MLRKSPLPTPPKLPLNLKKCVTCILYQSSLLIHSTNLDEGHSFTLSPFDCCQKLLSHFLQLTAVFALLSDLDSSEYVSHQHVRLCGSLLCTK